MTSHLTNQQLERFWAGSAAQTEIVHIQDCDICRTRLAELVIDEEEVVPIGRLYLMWERRMFATTEADTVSFGRFMELLSPP